MSRAASPGPGDVAVSTFCEVRKRGLRRAANHPHQHRCDDLDGDQGLAGPQLRGADLKALVHERYRRRFGATSGGFGRRARDPAGVSTAPEPGAPLSSPVVPQSTCSPPLHTGRRAYVERLAGCGSRSVVVHRASLRRASGRDAGRHRGLAAAPHAAVTHTLWRGRECPRWQCMRRASQYYIKHEYASHLQKRLASRGCKGSNTISISDRARAARPWWCPASRPDARLSEARCTITLRDPHSARRSTKACRPV